MSREIRSLTQSAARVAILGQLVETFDTDEERRELVLGLYSCGAIKESTADMLIEAYGLEVA